MRTTLRCDMKRDCPDVVTHIDEKGFVYCSTHGVTRKSHCSCRRLLASEIGKLERGETITYKVTP